MLTQQDLKAIGDLIDKKVATDIAAIQARLSDLESGRITKIDFIGLRVTLDRVEKRVTAIEGRMNRVDERLEKTLTREDAKNFATKDDLKQFATKADLKNLATKRSLKMMENRLIKSINNAVDSLDNKIMNHEKRIKNVESSFRLS